MLRHRPEIVQGQVQIQGGGYKGSELGNPHSRGILVGLVMCAMVGYQKSEVTNGRLHVKLKRFYYILNATVRKYNLVPA